MREKAIVPTPVIFVPDNPSGSLLNGSIPSVTGVRNSDTREENIKKLHDSHCDATIQNENAGGIFRLK
jgi:hypothetical protein